MDKIKAILLFGAPGSGKGTQGKMLGTLPGYRHVSSGDLFRALDPKSELGKVFLQYSTKGELVPDEFTIRLWRDHTEKLIATGKLKPATEIVILDGIPRNVAQAEMMAPNLDLQKIVVLRAVHNKAEMVRRLKERALKENRLDDANEKTIQNRMDVYEKESRPVLSFYPKQYRIDIDALQDPLTVAHDIISALLGRTSDVAKCEPPPPVAK